MDVVLDRGRRREIAIGFVKAEKYREQRQL